MASAKTLLIEIGTEELPPKNLKPLRDAFQQAMLEGLLEAELVADHDARKATPYAAPRRLGISVANVLHKQQDQQVERRGPSVKAAFNDAGEPTQAALGFAQSCGTTVDNLQRLKTDKGEWLAYTINETGKSIEQLLPELLEQAIKRLPIAKRMRWGSGDAEFVRPVHWLVAMFGEAVVPVNLLGINASNVTYGHRFHSSGPITISHADDYAKLLQGEGSVIARYQARQDLIEQQINELATKHGGQIEDDPALLNEVTGLVEYPNAILGDIDKEFLEVPQECLISSMRDHQKYFHVINNDGKLLPHFITVSNINSKHPERVREGNERVLRARLADARFFWETDLQQSLESRLEKLDSVLFHAKLGSIHDKTKRIVLLTEKLADLTGADSKIASRGALLAKADLVSNMVGEFDELQGIMGHYYADRDSEDKLVGECIEQHYWPKFAGDRLPQSREAQTVSLADKLDSLVGIFAAGELPTGDKDPYALRRAALGILRILIECEQPVDISTLVSMSAQVLNDNTALSVDNTTQEQARKFISGRLTALKQNTGISVNTINAVLACQDNNPLDFNHRVEAVHHFSQSDDSTNLASANKRISNILKKASPAKQVDTALFEEDAEKQLHATIETTSKACAPFFEGGNYQPALEQLASLREPVDQFFDQVMVMSDDKKVQENRLALLNQIRQLFLQVADIALLQ